MDVSYYYQILDTGIRGMKSSRNTETKTQNRECFIGDTAMEHSRFFCYMVMPIKLSQSITNF